MPENKPELQVISIIARFSDGSCRQIIIKESTEDLILDLIVQVEGKLTVLEEKLEGVEIKKSK